MDKILKKKNGFTLMELLIVIAIIVVLVAISIPIFKGQITKANEAADVASLRSFYSEHQDNILVNGEKIADAMSAAATIELNYPDKLNCTGTTITYTANTIDNNGSHVFLWSFETSEILN